MVQVTKTVSINIQAGRTLILSLNQAFLFPFPPGVRRDFTSRYSVNILWGSKAVPPCAPDVLEQISQVEERSVVLRVDVQSSPVEVLCLLGAVRQRAQVVQGAGVARVQPGAQAQRFHMKGEGFSIRRAENPFSHSVLDGWMDGYLILR